ncbi:MAG TPA: hypothetical protein VKU41_05745 [Polyangiaceae bacterium]|nr:hypothetical protein [Polyangiaceae bacterium]
MNPRRATSLRAGLFGGLLVAAAVLPTHAASAGGGSPSSTNPTSLPEAAVRARALIAALDYDDARRELEGADGSDPRVALEKARLAVDELDCDGAAAILARAEVQKTEDGDVLADIARGCQRVTAALVRDADDARAIEVLWQDEHDRALGPLLMDTIARARDALSRDLGVDWPRPTRVVVVRDLLSLSAMTGLPYRSAQTTGTVAVAKWGRVNLLSPRASLHGFAWRDTVAHELTHLAVTRATADRAPLWLQEGVAKNEEVRWRDPGPFDDRPSPESVTQRGAELGLTLPLDRLGPSVAMLPSADAAAVAFAEVTSFVRFYMSSGTGTSALRDLLAGLREGKNPDAALVAASGADLKAWDVRWKAYLASRPRVTLSPMSDLGPHAPASLATLRDLRDRTRLAELLLARRHAGEALVELGPRQGAPQDETSSTDPAVRWLRGRALEEVGKRAEGEALVADPLQVTGSFGPWWAMRGRWARLRADEPTAARSFAEALAADPFDPEGACETVAVLETPADPVERPLCDAARAWVEPEDVHGNAGDADK